MKAFVRWLREGALSAVAILALAVLAGLLCVVAYQHAHPEPVTGDHPLPSSLRETSDQTAPNPFKDDTGEVSTTLPDRNLSSLWLGGSYLAGFGATDADRAYLPLTVKALSKGRTVDVKRVDQSLAEPQKLIAAAGAGAPYDLVVTDLGSGDLDLGAADLGSQFASVATAIRNASPDAVLLCLGTWSPADQDGDRDDAMSSACTDAGGTFVKLSDLSAKPFLSGPAGDPVFSGNASRPKATSDGAAPNDRGYQRIAQRLESQLKA